MASASLSSCSSCPSPSEDMTFTVSPMNSMPLSPSSMPRMSGKPMRGILEGLKGMEFIRDTVKVMSSLGEGQLEQPAKLAAAVADNISQE